MEHTNHHNSEHDPLPDTVGLPHLVTGHAPDSLLPNVLARLQSADARLPGEPSVEACLAALNDPAWQVRTVAIQSLGALGKRAPLEPLVAALRDEDASVRAAAVRALGSLGKRTPLDSLLAALHDPEWLVREMAAMTLGTQGKRVPVEALVTAVHDENTFVCRAAALSLVQAHFAGASTPPAQSAARPRRSLRLIQGGLVALLVLVSMLFAWLPRVQPPNSLAPGAHAPGARGAILYTYQGGVGVEGSPVWPSRSQYLALLSSFGYSVQVWDLATGNLVENPLVPVPFVGPHTASAWSWSPDGRYLAVTSEDTITHDATLQVWDTVQGRNSLTVRSHANGILQIAWAPDGKRIASSGNDGVVQVWDPFSGQKLLTLAGHPGGDHRLLWSSDTRSLLLSSPDGTIQLWNAVTGAAISTFHGQPSALVALSPDGRLLVSSDDQGTLSVWNTFTGRELATYQGLSEGVSFLEWSPDGRRILAADESEVQVWDAITGQTLLAFPNPTVSNSGLSSSESRQIFTANESEVQVWSAISGQVLLAFLNPAASSAWQISPDGRYVGVGSWNDGVQVWDVVTGRKITSYQSHNAHVQVLAWSSDNQRIAFAGSDGTVYVWNVVSGSEIVTYQGLAHVVALTWSPDNKLIAATSEDNTVHVLQAT